MPRFLIAALALTFMLAPGDGADAFFGQRNQNCVDPARAADPDIRRQAREIASQRWCVTERRFNSGGRGVLVHDIDTRRRGPLHVVIHDDEDASFPIALYGARRFGGRIVVLEAGERRFLHGRDPNRAFSNGRPSARGCTRGAPDPAFARNILNRAGRTVIAYHTNDNGYSGDRRGGSGSISIRRNSSVLTPFPARGDEDNLILIAGKSASPDRRARRAIETLNRAGAHVIYELVSARGDDCSLSNHLILTGGPRYFNIEVQHGDVRAGRTLVDALDKLI